MSIIKTTIYRWAFILMILFTTNNLIGQSAPNEYQLKAAFLYNFTQFVNWPSSSFTSPNAPLVIGVIGKNPFGTYLEQTISGESANGHPIIFQHYSSNEEIKSCQILFINMSEKKKITEIINTQKNKAILTVSDTPHFLEYGGIVKFLNKNDKIKLQVNLKAAKEASLVISSKLLRLVEIVENTNN